MKWFKHDSDASSDAKIKKLIIRHGAVGYAVYFHCLELISSGLKESNLTFELEHDAEIIADNLKIQGDGMNAGVDIVNKIMTTIIELDLFLSSNDRIFCTKLAKRLDSSMTSNPKFRKLIQKSHDRVMIESVSSHDTVMQEETRRDKKRLDKTIIEEKREERKISPPPSKTPFSGFNDFNKKPDAQVFEPDKTNPNINRKRLSEIKSYWKSKTILPQSKMLDFNTSMDSSILETMMIFPNTDIFLAIDNYEKCFNKIEPKYRIKSFTNFMTSKKIETWSSDSAVEEYFPKESDSKKQPITTEEDLDAIFGKRT